MNNLLCAQALTYVGQREFAGKRANSVIVDMLRGVLPWVRSDETPWCSAFVYHIAKECGYTPTHANAAARSWLREGTQVGISHACPGDIVILSRPGSSWSGHVGFLCRRTTRYIWILAGNQGNRVSIRAFPMSRLLGVRRLSDETTIS